jgi:hypothetical protein
MTEKQALLKTLKHWEENIIALYEQRGDDIGVSSEECALCMRSGRFCSPCILFIYGFVCNIHEGPWKEISKRVSQPNGAFSYYDYDIEGFWNMYTVLQLIALSEGYGLRTV